LEDQNKQGKLNAEHSSSSLSGAATKQGEKLFYCQKKAQEGL